MVQVLDWTRRFNFGGPRSTSNIRNIIIHVTVNAPGTPAENVANYQITSQSGSYHELVDANARVLIENTDDWVTWSTGNKGNYIGLHRSFVMRGTETRAQWLKYDAMLRAGAQRDAQWAKRYNIPIVKLSPADLRAGKKGFCGHVDTQTWGGTDHVDPGPGFPWDYYLQLVREYAGQAPKPAPRPAPKTGGNMNTHRDIVKPINKFTGDFIKGFCGPIYDRANEAVLLGKETINALRDIKTQLTGTPAPGKYDGFDLNWLVRNFNARKGKGTVPEIVAANYNNTLITRRKIDDLEAKIDKIAAKVGA